MEIPERGEEGYLVMFSEDELEELKRISNTRISVEQLKQLMFIDSLEN